MKKALVTIAKNWILLLALFAISACVQPPGETECPDFPTEQLDCVGVSDYLRQVTQSVASNGQNHDYSIILYGTPRVQAVSIPGETIGLTRGMLNLVVNEAELACVIAHEIAHHQLGHVAQEFGIRDSAAIPEQFDGDESNSYEYQNILNEAGPVCWNQESEVEADQLGAELCARAGYDPTAMIYLFERISARTGESQVDSTDLSHEEALKTLTERASGLFSFLQDNDLRGDKLGHQDYWTALTALESCAENQGEGATHEEPAFVPLFLDQDNPIWWGYISVYETLDEMYEDFFRETQDATIDFISRECDHDDTNYIPSNHIDAWGHCWAGCEFMRRYGISEAGILREIGREFEDLLGIRGHDSFWQDANNESYGTNRYDEEGTCDDICNQAVDDGDLDLTAPERKLWDCATGELIDPPPSALSHGDPHITTGDGFHYSFQAAGEFVGLQSNEDDLVIQVRQEPWGESTTVSNNTAVAANVHGHRVGVYTTDRGIVVKVDSEVRDSGTSWEILPAGGRILHRTNEVVLRWQDGTELLIKPFLDFLNIFLKVSYERKGSVTGLFGDFDGSPENDMRTRDGRQITLSNQNREARFEQLYDVYGNSWRISETESLFDYLPGETTELFQIMPFPLEDVSVSTLSDELREQAREICIAAGVEDQPLLDDCILDVGVTGKTYFAQSAASVGQVLTGKVEVDVPVHSVELVIDQPGEHLIEEFSGIAGQEMFFQTMSLSGSLDLSNWAVLDPSGEILFRHCLLCNQPGAYVLPYSGTYSSLIIVSGNERGTFVGARHVVPAPDNFEIVLPIDIVPDFPGDGAGRIEIPGTKDLYKFEGHAGQTLSFLTTAIASQLYFGKLRLENQLGEPIVDQLLPSAGLSISPVTLETDGNYTIRVSGGNSWPVLDDYGYGEYSLSIQILENP